jgi:hypothetical protein
MFSYKPTAFSPDLPKFTLENLSFVLRHRGFWPQNFEWDYRYGNTCAIGLIDNLWGYKLNHLWGYKLNLNTLNLTAKEFRKIFLNAEISVKWIFGIIPQISITDKIDVTPEMVADKIDIIVAKHAKKLRLMNYIFN